MVQQLDKLTEAASQFRAFIENKAADKNGVYARLAERITSDVPMLTLAAAAKNGLPVDLFFASVNYAALVSGNDLQTIVGCHDEPELEWQQFKTFCLGQHAVIADRLAAQRVQTNEPSRCAAITLALCKLRSVTNWDSISFLDVGTSAGLHLICDDFRYTFENGTEHESFVVTYPDSAPDIDLTTIIADDAGSVRTVPRLAPKIVDRVGLDLNPVDLAVHENRLWVKSFVWPEESDRRKLIDKSIDKALERNYRMVRGDVLDSLEPMYNELLGPNRVICISHMISQLSQSTKEYVLRFVKQRIERENCALIMLERVVNQELRIPAKCNSVSKSSATVTLTTRAGTIDLGRIGSHGGWIAWI